MADTLYIISTIAFVLAIVMLIVAIALFVGFRIPRVIGDLSGRTARKTIAGMRKKNEKMGERFAEIKRNKPVTEPTTTQNEETGLLQENVVNLCSTEETELLPVSTDTEGMTAPLGVEVSDAGTESVSRPQAEPIVIIKEVIYIHTNEVLC